MKAIAPLLLAAVLLPATPLVSADVLLLDAIAEVPANIEHPSRGMSMAQVKQKFGEPQQEFPWVGDPPITRWVYEKFTVYFEHNLVLETVVHRNPQ
ncbi:hypothetical protein ACFL0R_05875 [Pseudomonadota bacterium]